MSKARFYTLGVAVATATLLADWLTKSLVVRTFRPGQGITLIPGCFDLRFVLNPGAAWGIFAGHRWPLVLLAAAAVLGLILWGHRLLSQHRPGAILYGLLLGGILGNAIDRIRSGQVIDFIDCYWRGHHFPAFNIADSAICVSVLALILLDWFHERRPAP